MNKHNNNQFHTPLYFKRVNVCINYTYDTPDLICKEVKPCICEFCSEPLLQVLKRQTALDIEYTERRQVYDEDKICPCNVKYNADRDLTSPKCLRNACVNNRRCKEQEEEDDLCVHCMSVRCIWCSVIETRAGAGKIIAHQQHPTVLNGFYCGSCCQPAVQERILVWTNLAMKIDKLPGWDSTKEDLQIQGTQDLRRADQTWLWLLKNNHHNNTSITVLKTNKRKPSIGKAAQTKHNKRKTSSSNAEAAHHDLFNSLISASIACLDKLHK